MIFLKRLIAMEALRSHEGTVLIEAHKMTRERKKTKSKPMLELRTEHHSYLGSQVTCNFQNIKGLGRIYQHTFIVNESRVVFAMIFTSKHAFTSAIILNDFIIAYFEQHQIPPLRILIDRGTEYNGSQNTMNLNCI